MIDKKIQELIIENKELKKQIKELKKRKKYGLVRETWKMNPDKQEQIIRDCQELLPVLTEVTEKEILNDISPTHILIEGDNYHALSSLYYTHKGKIDVIYIDPPYNTGNNDFRYHDNFSEEYVKKDDQFRHSKWLNFMSVRLRLAKELLSREGVIFISIDDNEFAQLRLLCDEIFGENNFIGNFVWNKKKKGSHLSKNFRSMTEYILCFGRNKNIIELFGENAYLNKQQPIVKRTNSLKNIFINKNVIKTTLSDGKYKKGKKIAGSTGVIFLNDFFVKNGVIINDLNIEGPFVWSQATLDDEIKLGTEIHLSNRFGFNVLRSNQDEKIKRPSSLLNIENGIGTNEDATSELNEIIGIDIYNMYPKPVSLISYLINTKTFFKKNAIILDFFAGSGTTGHAVAQLNSQDGGNRQAILVTNNEGNICTEVTYPRLLKVINGYTDKKGNKIKGLGGNLKYYKTDFVPNSTTDIARRKLVHGSLAMLILAECTYKFVASSESIRYIYENHDTYMIVIFETSMIQECLDKFDHLPEKKIVVYQFTHNDALDKSAYDKFPKSINLKPLPDVLIKAYQTVFNITFSIFKKI